MQTSSELQDIHKSVSLLESCAHALCLVPCAVLCFMHGFLLEFFCADEDCRGRRSYL